MSRGWFFQRKRFLQFDDVASVTTYDKLCWFLKHQWPWQPDGPVVFPDRIPDGFPEDLRIVSVGDLMYQGVEYHLEAFLPEWKRRYGGALRIGNLEAPLALSRAPSHRRSLVHFNASPTFWDQIREMEFHVLSVANNHSLDMGAEGLRETCERLRGEGILPIGTPFVRDDTLEWNGRRIGFLATTYGTNLTPFDDSVHRLPLHRADAARWKAEFLERVRAVRERTDLVVLAMHWGHECETRADPALREVARELVDAGADLVLGHHPHVVQPAEVLERPGGGQALVLHSQGNFLSRSAHPLTRTGHVFDIRVALGGGRARFAFAAEKVMTRFLTMKTRFL